MKTKHLAPVLCLVTGGAGAFAYEYGLHRAPPNWFIILVFLVAWTSSLD